MSIKTLPTSLIDSVLNVLTKSTNEEVALTNSLIEQGLKTYGAGSVGDLTEAQAKELHSWLRKEMELQREARLVSECDCEETTEEEKAEEKEESCATTSDKEEIKENIAISPSELAGNGAVGVRTNTKVPAHADVLQDISPIDGKAEYRMLVQFPTNERPVIVPPVTLPGAPTLEALKVVVEGLGYSGQVIESAITNATELPHKDPHFSGETNSAK